jgi:hypothetical protein
VPNRQIQGIFEQMPLLRCKTRLWLHLTATTRPEIDTANCALRPPEHPASITTIYISGKNKKKCRDLKLENETVVFQQDNPYEPQPPITRLQKARKRARSANACL